MRSKTLLLCTLLLAAAPALAEPSKGQLFELGSHRGKLLFREALTETVEGGQLKAIRRVFSYPDGREAVVDEATFEGGALKRYRLEQKQTGAQGALEVSGGQVRFSHTAAGKTKTAEESLTPDLVVAPTVVPYLQARWDVLLKGGEVKVRYASLERRETVGFTFAKVSEKRVGDRDAMVVRMKPTSFIIAALVDPLYFTFDTSNRRLLEVIGRTAPMIQVDGKWKDLDVEMVLEY
jgi:hypothetical protein